VRDIVRLSMVLALIAVMSAALLTGIHNITEPVIKEREQREYIEALEQFFPELADYESEEIDGDTYDLVYDQDANLMGIMATVTTYGYEGEISYNLAVDDEGEIKGIIVTGHSETPGIGDVITTDEFQEQFIGKGYEDPIQAGEDVDTVSGATESTGSVISSVRRTVITIGENFLDKEGAGLNLPSVDDGVYLGSVEGTRGILTAEVEVLNGIINRIEIVEQHETDAYFVESYPLIPERIIEEQSLNVDTQTGATLSAERIIFAVENALNGAPLEEGSGGDSLDE